MRLIRLPVLRRGMTVWDRDRLPLEEINGRIAATQESMKSKGCTPWSFMVIWINQDMLRTSRILLSLSPACLPCFCYQLQVKCRL